MSDRTWDNSHLGVAAVVAAIIPLMVLYHGTQESSGITLARVSRAVGQAQNIRMVSLDPDSNQVIYELWIARELNRTGILTPERCVVYDLARGEKEDIVSGVVTRVGDSELANVREIGDNCLGFTSSGIRADALGTRRDGPDGREVYEFTWDSRRIGGDPIPIRYEVEMDTSTGLPVSIRLFRIELPENGWICRSRVLFEYLTQARMRAVMAGESLVVAGSY